MAVDPVYLREWRKANPEKVAAQARRYRAKHPGQVKAVVGAYLERSKETRQPREAERARARRAADPEGQKRRNEAYQARRRQEREQLAGRPRPATCDLCREEGKTVFDHCHRLGHFRGWLCDRCNRVLGSVKDDTGLLRQMATYLENTDGQAHDRTAQEPAYLCLRLAGAA